MSVATDLSLVFIVIGVLMLLAEISQPGSFLLVPATVLLVLGGIGLGVYFAFLRRKPPLE